MSQAELFLDGCAPRRGPWGEDAGGMKLVHDARFGISGSLAFSYHAAIAALEAKYVEIGDDWRELISERLRAWTIDPGSVSQKKFWRLHDVLFDCRIQSKIDIRSIAEIVIQSDSSLSRPSDEKLLPCLNVKSFEVVNGQHRYFAIPKYRREISARSIRWVIQSCLKVIAQLEDRISSTAAIAILSNSFIKNTAKRTTWRAEPCFQKRGFGAPSTREWVLSFALFTGNPPPAVRATRPAETWALVTIDTIAQERADDPVPKPDHKRSVRDAVRVKHLGPCLGSSTRAHAPASSCVQPSRRRRTRGYSALAQSAHAIRPSRAWKMACHV
jgi:hypothetical protein